jgi:A/G-specific adenine glycosylase
MAGYTQAVMDLGATVCTRARPRCDACPLAAQCLARRDGRVDELPAPRARKATPLRHAQMLVALHDGRVLLEQRPPVGLWGGLLALPQFDDAAQLARAVEALAPGMVVQALPARRHAFTHFTLQFSPQLAALAAPAPLAAEPRQRWLPLVEIESAALPAPLRTLLIDVRDRLAAGILQAPPAERPRAPAR